MLRIYGTNPIKAALEAKTLIKVLVSLDYKNKGLIESIKKTFILLVLMKLSRFLWKNQILS